MAKRKSNKKIKHLLDTNLHPDAAGIDIGAEELVAAIPPERSGEPVRTFSTFTSGLHELRDWLLEHGVRTVAMESTGNYWIAAYQILEDAGLEVVLTNARHIKAVPGKKTDALIVAARPVLIFAKSHSRSPLMKYKLNAWAGS